MGNRGQYPANKPIFVSGSPRSGTSILAFLINENSQVLSYLEPSGFYKYFNEYFLRYPIPFGLFKFFFCNRTPSRLAHSVSATVPHGKLTSGLDPKRIFSGEYIRNRMQLFACCDTKEKYVQVYHQFAERVFGDFAKSCDKKKWCVKQPGYLYANINKIYQIHSNMKFIHIVRDGRDVISSIMKQPWVQAQPTNFDYALNQWLLLNQGDMQSDMIPSRNLLTVRLEDLVSREDEVEKICSFAEIEYEDKMRSFYLDRVKVNQCNVGRWKDELTEEQLASIIRRGGNLLKKYKYA